MHHRYPVQVVYRLHRSGSFLLSPLWYFGFASLLLQCQSTPTVVRTLHKHPLF